MVPFEKRFVATPLGSCVVPSGAVTVAGELPRLQKIASHYCLTGIRRFDIRTKVSGYQTYHKDILTKSLDFSILTKHGKCRNLVNAEIRMLRRPVSDRKKISLDHLKYNFI